MSSEAVRITEKKMIQEIFRTRFQSGKIYIKTSSINIQVETFSFNDGVITAAIPEVDEDMSSVIFYVRDHEDVIFSHAVLIKKDDAGALVYEPLDVQILPIPRKEERRSVAPVGTSVKVPVYISNIISDFTVHECLNLSKRRVDLIKGELLKKLKNSYSDSEIVLLNERVKDPRMFYFNRKRKPYFMKNVHDVDDPEKVNSDEDLKYFKTYIFQQDSLDHKAKIFSEISVPLLYKMMLPFGYIKSASMNAFNDEDYSVIRKFGMSASTLFTNDRQIIVSSDDKVTVTDLSMNGLGIFFKEKVLIKHFKENSLIIFTIFLPEKKQSTLLCEVKNISLIKNYIYRVGCEILNIEAIGEVYYSEYLEGLEQK